MSSTNDDDRWSNWEPPEDDDGTIKVVALSANAVFFVLFMSCILWCIWRYRNQSPSENQEDSDNESTTPQVNPVAELV